MTITLTINLWWLVWLLLLVYIAVSVLGIRQASGMVASEIHLYRSYTRRYTLALYLTRSCGHTWRWLFLPAHLVTYALGWLIERRKERH